MSKGLGRGLDALIPHLDSEDHIQHVAVRQLRPNPYQPRKTFAPEAMEELTESIRQHGLIQPILVRKSLHGYEIVAGERRWRAAKMANLKTVPVVVKDFSDEQVMEIALIENLQREDLNAMEVAQAYEKLMQQFHLTQEELAAKVGKSRPHVANFLRLLQLPPRVQEMLAAGELTMGHARALLGLPKSEDQIAWAERVVREKMSVRQLEEEIQKQRQRVSRETSKKKKPARSHFIVHAEEMLQQNLGTPVRIVPGKKKGRIEIDFYSEEDLNRIMDLILQGREEPR
ncbi:MAG: hypothetical protein A6D91_02645 [Bacillaceae bacterium G1]|nr:hypothetical protein [Bacillota bacterium]OJF17942.1 MAG: hypothetical protein A6D91_02645 [Bacillaceae bacterium G1]